MTPGVSEETKVEPENKVEANVTFKREKMTFWDLCKAASVMGVGAALALVLVPRIQKQNEANQTQQQQRETATQAFIQQEMIKSAREQGAALAASAAAQTAAAEAMGDMSESIDELADQQSELLAGLGPLVRQLDRVADAVQASTEQGETADAEEGP